MARQLRSPFSISNGSRWGQPWPALGERGVIREMQRLCEHRNVACIRQRSGGVAVQHSRGTLTRNGCSTGRGSISGRLPGEAIPPLDSSRTLLAVLSESGILPGRTSAKGFWNVAGSLQAARQSLVMSASRVRSARRSGGSARGVQAQSRVRHRARSPEVILMEAQAAAHSPAPGGSIQLLSKQTLDPAVCQPWMVSVGQYPHLPR